LKVRFGEFLLDTDSRQLFRDRLEVHLQPKTFDLLELLVRTGPKALSKQYIRGQLWPGTVVGEASLTVAVAELRAALGDDAREPRFVRTVYGFGYAFAGEAEANGAKATVSASGAVAPRVLWRSGSSPSSKATTSSGATRRQRRIDAPGVSRRHPSIRVEGERATIEDLGSKNGTYVGDGEAAITGPVPLADDARFRLGRVLLVFRSSPESGSTMTEHLR
jgi:DNA-binding winged helix-turn-helix (wHTH) protein